MLGIGPGHRCGDHTSADRDHKPSDHHTTRQRLGPCPPYRIGVRQFYHVRGNLAAMEFEPAFHCPWKHLMATGHSLEALSFKKFPMARSRKKPHTPPLAASSPASAPLLFVELSVASTRSAPWSAIVMALARVFCCSIWIKAHSAALSRMSP